MNETIVAVTFDPKSPSSLIVAPKSVASSDFTFVLSDDGVGCNAEEIRCLMRLIDIYNSVTTSSSRRNSDRSSSKTICKSYRIQILQCIEQLEQRLSTDAPPLDNDDPMSQQSSEKKTENEYKANELLKITHAISHLTEIYLCNDNNEEEHGEKMLVNDFRLLLSPNNSMPKKEVNQMGIVTADTIRYIRYHHLEDIDSYVESLIGENSVGEMLESNQPEHWISDNYQSGDLTPFWDLIRKLVQRGLMKDAWNVLRRHSACVRAQEKFQIASGGRSQSGFIDQTVRDDIEAFALIEKLLLFAPIPGGRSEVNDSGLGGENDDENFDDEIIDDDDDDYWNGIAIDAYKLWDTSNDSDSSYNLPLTPSKRKQDTPIEFNIHAAMNIYNSWKMQISSALKSNSALRNLTRRIPNLQNCVWDIIINTEDSFVDSDDWGERLVAELLYVRPNVRKDDVVVRAKSHMKRCGINVDENTSQQEMEDIVLEVMSGNAGTVIEALHCFGGASGAALPATMVSMFVMEMKITFNNEHFLTLNWTLFRRLYFAVS